MIVLFQPGVDYDMSLFNCREPFGIEDLSSKCTIEAFVIPVLPGTAGVDLDWLDADLLKPGL